MTSTATRAALELLAKSPATQPMQKTPLPSDVLTLIQVAAGDAAAIAQTVKSTGLTAQDCREMAAIYLRKNLFSPDASDYRLLGLKRDAKSEQIAQHRRWLLKWLHPDVNSNADDQVCFNRVTAAAKRLSEIPLTSPVAASQKFKSERRSTRLEKTDRRGSRQVRRRKMLPLWPRVKRRLRQLAFAMLTLGALAAVAYSFRTFNFPSLAIN
jgi:hypothetical protein